MKGYKTEKIPWQKTGLKDFTKKPPKKRSLATRLSAALLDAC